jgi:hypothetical protein
MVVPFVSFSSVHNQAARVNRLTWVLEQRVCLNARDSREKSGMSIPHQRDFSGPMAAIIPAVA